MECDELQCSVCDHDYSDENIPRNLGCGHSVCSTCVDMLIPISKKCPECRGNFMENKSSELPINYPILRLSRIFAYEKIDPDVLPEPKLPLSYPSSKSQSGVEKCPSHKCFMYFMCMRCGVSVCRDCLNVDHLDPPRGRCFIMAIDEAIEKIKKSCSKTTGKHISYAGSLRKKLERELRVLILTFKIFKRRKKGDHMKIFDKDLEHLEKEKETILTRLSLLGCVTNDLKEANQRVCKAVSPEEITILMKELDNYQSAFENYGEEENMRKLPSVLTTLLDGKKDLKDLVQESEPVYALSEEEDKVRWTSIVFMDGHLHLYSLRDSRPPEKGVFLPFELVRDLVPKESPRMFLEVGWHGDVKGRVYVHMFGDTPRSRQTLLLCSGERGPSYKNTCFYEVANYKNSCQLLSGGDYENNDGSGGCSIVEGIISGGPYLHEIRAGLFVSWPAHERWHLGNFDIYLKDSPGIYDHSAHGMVEQGLEILREAAEITPVTDTSVMDCGLVIPT